jgi:hypothetical protein
MLLQSHIDAWRKHCARTAWRNACRACRRTGKSAFFHFELLAEFAFQFRLALLGAAAPLGPTRPRPRGGAAA